MKKELEYFYIENSYGGNQEWFGEMSMRLGGCGAETAIEICIYSDKYFGTKLCPLDINNLTKKDYAAFGSIMKAYLHPRLRGIDRLDIFTEGFARYLADKNSNTILAEFEGSNSFEKAKEALKKQIDKGFPIAYLCLNHSDRRFKEYQWHWFIINGYEEKGENIFVKAVTYSNYEWLDFRRLWNTEKAYKGGMVFTDLVHSS